MVRDIAGGYDGSFHDSGHSIRGGVTENAYKVIYSPGETAVIPFDALGDSYRNKDLARYRIEGIEGEFHCTFDYRNRQLKMEMPVGKDIPKGEYFLTIILEESGSGEQSVCSDKVKLIVEEDVAASHLLNSAVAYNDNSDVVLYFKNGTGDARIAEITSLSFMAKMGAPEGSFVNGFTINPENFTYDLEKGILTIPKEYFRSCMEEYGWEFLSCVYFGSMNYKLANGKEITTDSYSGDPVENEEFVNDNSDRWCLMFSDSDYGITLEERYTVCPGESKEMQFQINAPEGSAIYFESADSSILTVNNAGVFTGVAGGTTEFTVRVTYNNIVIARASSMVSVGHSLGKEEGRAPACTENGWKEHWRCSLCGALFGDEAGAVKVTEQDLVLKATGHAGTELKNAAEATCTEEGYTGDRVCKACGEIVEKGHVIPKAAHDFQGGRCVVCGAAETGEEEEESAPAESGTSSPAGENDNNGSAPAESGDGNPTQAGGGDSGEPAESEDGNSSPQTGENGHIAGMIAVALIALGGMVAVVVYDRKKRAAR